MISIFNKNQEKVEEKDTKFSITRSITNQDGESFKIDDIISVIYSDKYRDDEEQKCRGRLSSINDMPLFDSITIDCSDKMNSKTKYIELRSIKSIKMA